MLCENCKTNEAIFYYHENINGNERTYRLCGDCFDKIKKDMSFDPTANSVSSLDLGAFFSDKFFDSPMKTVDSLLGSLFAPLGNGFHGAGSAAKCPTCGATVHDISNTGKAGCPDCYASFRRELSGAIERLHGHTSHTGRMPSRMSKANEMKDRISALESERIEAVKSENYERAAEIRDELKKLRGGL